jgi:uncharacterized protein (DUF302 family)
MPPILPLLRALALSLALAAPAWAEPLAAREGWTIAESLKGYDRLLADLKDAVTVEGLVVVTEAGPTEAAARRGVEIPGNRVVGVHRNDYAVRVLDASLAATIEQPIRFLVVEAPDGTGRLAYERPSSVFTPYYAEGGDALRAVAAELDAAFAAIAERALAE